MRRLWNVPILAIAMVALMLTASTLSAGEPPQTAAAKRVSVRDNLFSPRSTTVSRGAKVTWIWKGQNDHNVTFRKVPRGTSKRGSGTKASGRFTRSFSKRGRYSYVCTIHVGFGMRGSVVAK